MATVVVGCASDDELSTATPSGEVDARRIEVLYDGASCTSSGPTELLTGEHLTPREVLSDHLLEPGVYALVAGNSGEVWFCGGFDVVGA